MEERPSWGWRAQTRPASFLAHPAWSPFPPLPGDSVAQKDFGDQGGARRLLGSLWPSGSGQPVSLAMATKTH